MEMLDDVKDWASAGAVWGPIVVCLAAAPLLRGKYSRAFFVEAAGTVTMIALTFAPGKWWGATGALLAPESNAVLGALHSVVPLDYVLHWFGVVAADYAHGGPQVNPGVATTMLALGKINYDQYVVHVAAQMLGGVVGFPLLQALAAFMGWTPLGGPGLDAGVPLSKSALDEFAAMFLLCVVIFAVNWEPSRAMQKHKYFYVVKQSLTAFWIRFLIVRFGAAGPAINPMLATTWAAYADGAFPNAWAHYAVYWLASGAGALAAALLYALYNEDAAFFGKKLRAATAGAAPYKSTRSKTKRA